MDSAEELRAGIGRVNPPATQLSVAADSELPSSVNASSAP